MIEGSLVETLGSFFFLVLSLGEKLLSAVKPGIDILLARKSIQTISLLAKLTLPIMRKLNTYLGGI